MRVRIAAVALALLPVFAAPAPAAEPPKPTVTKVFRVADLVTPLPDLAAPGRPGAWKRPTVAESADQLARLVTGVVRPYSWAAMGGPGRAEFRDTGCALVVHNTPDVVAEVADLLEALRRLQDVSVCTEARVLRVPAGFCEKAKLTADAVLTERELATLLADAQTDRAANVIQFPKVTTFDGQVATVRCGERRTFVTGVEAARVNGRAVLVPTSTPVDLGDTLALCGRVSPDGRSVSLRASVTRVRVVGEGELLPVVTQVAPVFEGGSRGTPIPFTQHVQAPDLKRDVAEKAAVVPCGGTVVLGRWKEAGRAEKAADPMPAKIPYLNRLFANVRAVPEWEVVVLATVWVVRAEPVAVAPMPRAAVVPAWPERYHAAGRQEVVAPFAQQLTSGYVANQIVWNEDFRPGTAELTKAGAERVRALARATPSADPEVYLQTAGDVVVVPGAAEPAADARKALDAKRAQVVRRYLDVLAVGDVAFKVQVVDVPAAVVPPAPYALRHAAAADVARAVAAHLDGKAANARVTFDAPSNTVFLRADPVVRQEVGKMIGALDAAPPQVLVQALVAKVPEGFLGDAGLAGEGGAIVLSPREVQMLSAHIRKEKPNGCVDILSRPQLHVVENQTGCFQIGDAREFVTGLEVGTQSGAVTVTPKKTTAFEGLKLEVTPRVGADGAVVLRATARLSHYHVTASEVSMTRDGGDARTFRVDRPVGSVFAAEATARVPDGHTVVLRGLGCGHPAGADDGPFTALARRCVCGNGEVLVLLTPHVVRADAVRPAGHAEPAPPGGPVTHPPLTYGRHGSEPYPQR